MESFQTFKFEEFNIKEEGDVLHSLLAEEFFFNMDPEYNLSKFIPLYPQ